jgi:hypothetical protein
MSMFSLGGNAGFALGPLIAASLPPTETDRRLKAVGSRLIPATHRSRS